MWYINNGRGHINKGLDPHALLLQLVHQKGICLHTLILLSILEALLASGGLVGGYVFRSVINFLLF